MKKLIIYLFIAICTVDAAFAINYQTPTAGNMNFYPLMQHQMEKQETLDFANDPEGYKKKRAEKDAKLDYIEGKTDANQYFKSPYAKRNVQFKNNTIPVNMQFTKDGSGQIKIQEIK